MLIACWLYVQGATSGNQVTWEIETIPQVPLVPRCWFQPHCLHPRSTTAQNHPQADKNVPNFLSRPGSPRPRQKVGTFFAKVSRQVRTSPPPQNKNRFLEGQNHRHKNIDMQTRLRSCVGTTVPDLLVTEFVSQVQRKSRLFLLCVVLCLPLRNPSLRSPPSPNFNVVLFFDAVRRVGLFAK